MKIVEIRQNLLVREDGMVKNINPEAVKKDWHYGSNKDGYRVHKKYDM